MAYTFHQKFCPAGLENNPNKDMTEIKYITIHTTGNYEPRADAESHAEYLFRGCPNKGGGFKKTSWHYTVDATSIWQSFEDWRMCWHAGDGGGDGNSKSIGVEICVNDKTHFFEACSNAAELSAGLMERYNISAENVVSHHHWSKANCPKEIRDGNWGVTWETFMDCVNAARVFLRSAFNSLETGVSEWAKDSWEWAVENEIVDGSDPRGYVTREQAVYMLSKVYRSG